MIKLFEILYELTWYFHFKYAQMTKTIQIKAIMGDFGLICTIQKNSSQFMMTCGLFTGK